MPLSLTVALSAELLESRTRRPLMRFLELPGDAGEVLAVVLPDGTVNLAVFAGRTGQVSALIVTSDKAVQVCVGDVTQNEALTLEAGGLLALLDMDVDAAHACTLSYTPGDGSEATCLVAVLGTWVQGDVPVLATLGGWIPAMLNQGGSHLDLLVATHVRPSDALPTVPAVYRSSNTYSGAPWRAEFPLTGGGQATALVTWDFSETIVAAVRPTDRPTASEIWRMGITYGDAADLLCTLPDSTIVTSLYAVGSWMLIGTDDGKVYRWDGISAPVLVLHDSQGHAVRLWRPVDYTAFMESPSGLRIWSSSGFGNAEAGSWTQLMSTGLTGTRCSNMVHFRDVDCIATGTEAGERVDVFEYTLVQGAILMHSFTERSGQRPGPLWAYNSVTVPTLYVGRMSLTATPLLELWEYGGLELVWRLMIDFADVDDPPEQNTSITAIAPVFGRGFFFVATGTPYEPYAVSSPAPRIYAYELPEGCRT